MQYELTLSKMTLIIVENVIFNQISGIITIQNFNLVHKKKGRNAPLLLFVVNRNTNLSILIIPPYRPHS